MMTVLRTPDERFQNLSDYAFEPHYITISDRDGSKLRVHYIDEGPREAPLILLMHGNPDLGVPLPVYDSRLSGRGASRHCC
jgi:haloalkane dehalogenase